MNLKTYIFPFLVCLTLVLCFEMAKVLAQDEEMVFPTNHTFVSSDLSHNGGSVVSKDSSGMSFRYTLNDGVDYPWANISFSYLEPPFHNISEEDKLVVRLKASEGRVLPIIFHTYLSGDSIPKNELDYQVSETDIGVTSEFTEHVIDFQSVNPSPWWLQERKIDKIGHANFSAIGSFKIASCRIIKRGVEDHVIIESIKIRRDWFWKRVGFYSLMVVSFLFFVYCQFKKWEKKRQKIIHFKPSEIEENDNDYIQFLSQNYANPELSLDFISDHFSENPKEISKSIKEETDLTFKQLLNSFRMEEAKRLLVETDQRSSDVAFSIGYENVTHFNRVFKDYLSQSPSEFRKNAIKTDL